jgi:hypothetical protein
MAAQQEWTDEKTLSPFGITSIDPTANKNMIVLPDRSEFERQSTYTKSDGTTGAAVDMSPSFGHGGLATEQAGYAG